MPRRACPPAQPYLTLYECPTLGGVLRTTALDTLTGLNLRSIWLEVDAAANAHRPQPSRSRLAIILDPALSARFVWRPSTVAAHVYKLFLAPNAELWQQARAEALGWLEAGLALTPQN